MKLLRDIDVALDYYVAHPDKTHVILQTYVLNRLYLCFDKVFFFFVDLPRPIVRFLRR